MTYHIFDIRHSVLTFTNIMNIEDIVKTHWVEKTCEDTLGCEYVLRHSEDTLGMRVQEAET